MFEFRHIVKLADTDAAGVLFFANQFRIIHNAYETFLHQNGFSINRMLYKENFRLPLVHAEADFSLPIYLSDELAIQITMTDYSTSSFTLQYAIYNKGILCGTAKTVYVSIDNKTGNTIELPDSVLDILKTIYVED